MSEIVAELWVKFRETAIAFKFPQEKKKTHEVLSFYGGSLGVTGVSDDICYDILYDTTCYVIICDVICMIG
jgi:hypothetical protein